MTITGTNFTGATQVQFNTTDATSYTVDSATQITAIVPAGATTGTIEVTTAGGTATSAGSFTVVGSSADLAIGIGGPAFATRGGNLVYTITLTNAGPGTASNVQVSLSAPAGITFGSNAGDCTAAFPCSFASLANGASRTITTTLGVPVGYTPAPIQVSTTVTSSTADPDATDNTESATSRFGTFYTLFPCRVADTRDPASPNGPPSLASKTARTLTLAGVCGIPAGATALAVNITETGATAIGNLRLYPADAATIPLVSTINFIPGLTRANNAIVAASADGSVRITVYNSSTAAVDMILDVTGYFE